MQGPNQRLKTTREVICSTGDKVVLPAGAFVKAVKKCYLPKGHPFLDDYDYNEKTATAAYSQFGMVLINRIDLDWNVY